MENKTNYFIPMLLSFIGILVVLICGYFIFFPRNEKLENTTSCPECPNFQKEILKKLDELNIKFDKKNFLMGN